MVGGGIRVVCGVVACWLAAAGCDDRRPIVRREANPRIDATTCEGTFWFSPRFPADPPCEHKCSRLKQRAVCAASPVVDGVAIEKVFEERDMIASTWDEITALDVPPPGVSWWLLTDENGTWKRTHLTTAQCGWYMGSRCDFDEVFQRRFELAVDDSRLAILGRAADGAPGDVVTSWIVYRGSGPPAARPVAPVAATATAAAMLAEAPLDLAAALEGAAVDHTSVVQAVETALAGDDEPLQQVADALRNADTRACLISTRALVEATKGRTDRRLYDVVLPRFAPCGLSPEAEDAWSPGRSCREALAACGITVPETVPVRLYDGMHGGAKARPVLDVGVEGWTVLEDGFFSHAPVWSRNPVVVSSRYRAVVSSGTAIIYLGADSPHDATAPLIVVETSDARGRTTDEAGRAWCEIPPATCRPPPN